MKAKTDGGPTEPNMVKPDYIENIFLLLKLVSSPDVISKFEQDHYESSKNIPTYIGFSGLGLCPVRHISPQCLGLLAHGCSQFSPFGHRHLDAVKVGGCGCLAGP
jgi:hypothetical protein